MSTRPWTGGFATEGGTLALPLTAQPQAAAVGTPPPLGPVTSAGAGLQAAVACVAQQLALLPLDPTQDRQSIFKSCFAGIATGP